MSDSHHDLFWDLAAEWLHEDGVERGTMMGTPCLRKRGQFVAMPGKRTFEGLIVKLAADRVTACVSEGIGEVFAPNGRVFKEWLKVQPLDPEQWERLVREALDRVP